MTLNVKVPIGMCLKRCRVIVKATLVDVHMATRAPVNPVEVGLKITAYEIRQDKLLDRDFTVSYRIIFVLRSSIGFSNSVLMINKLSGVAL